MKIQNTEDSDMSNELLIERRALLKKRFKSSTLLLFAVFCVTVYNCVAEFFFPSFVFPVSFYLPQFAANMAKTFSGNVGALVLCTLGCLILCAATLSCIVFTRKNYRLASVISVISSIDIVLLIYIGLQSLLTKGFQGFFVINMFAHIGILFLAMRLRRAAEGLEVLPEE